MAKNGDVSLLVTVPVCSFRKGYAREYFETENISPPSTIYGFLLSLVGEEDRNRYIGTNIAYAVLKHPEMSVVLRTVWRMKNKKQPPGYGNNRRPDYQEILTGLQLAVWIRGGALANRIRLTGDVSWKIDRYGGLSLGESRNLVNDIQWFPEWTQEMGQWLVNDPQGNISLPVWVDHVGSKDTIWRQFIFVEGPLSRPGHDDNCWIHIER